MRLGITETVKHLLIINVLVFVGMLAVGNGVFTHYLALYYPTSENFELWQIFTHMFMHSEIMYGHIFFNMFGLWMFGTPVESQLGSKKLLFLYISSGLGAVLLTYLVYFFHIASDLQVLMSSGIPKEIWLELSNIDISNGQFYDRKILYNNTIALFENRGINPELLLNEGVFDALYNVNYRTIGAMVGASGCLMGVLAAFGVMNPDAKLMMIFLPIPIKAKYFIPGIILLDLFSALTGTSFFSPSNTAFVAHIGGAITGFLIMWFWRKNSMNKYRWN